MLWQWAQLPQFKRKVEKAKEVIAEALSIAPAYVAISWGKDSTALLHLTQQIKPDVTAVSFTHPERDIISNYSEVVGQYAAKNSTNLINIELDGDHVPAKVQQARLWESLPMAIVGVRKEESKARAITGSKYGLIHQYKSGSWRCHPLLYWGWKDVWAYLISKDLPYLKWYESQSIERGRTTDHLSKTIDKSWQVRRLESFAASNPDYYDWLKTNHKELF
jgi:3'-phosphoadenosine 5'-phosphosulfate sulfotransferase (PAPS reductase)/FAD synthetase